MPIVPLFLESPVTIPNKLISLATKTRNRWASGPEFSARWIDLFLFTETSGTSLANNGLGVTYQSETPAGVGTLVNGPTFINDGTQYAPYTNFDGVNQYATVAIADGATVENDSGTFVVVFRSNDAASTTVRTILHSGGPALQGRLWVRRLANNHPVNPDGLLVTLKAASENIDLHLSGVDWSEWHVCVVTWGAAGTAVYLDTLASKTADADSSYVQFPNTTTVLIGKPTAAAYHDMDCSGVYRSDAQIGDDDVLRILADPWILGRPAPAMADVFATCAGPGAFRPTATGIMLALTTGHTTLSGANVNWRVKYGTDPANLATTATAAGQAASATDVMSAIALTGLTASTRYYYRAEWTPDDTDATLWAPMPVGLGEFWTQRTDATPFKGARVADDHVCNSLEGGMPDPVNDGFGIELFLAAAGPRSRKHYAAWRAMVDIIKNCQPEFVIFMGDGAFFDSNDAGSYPSLGDTDATTFEAAAQYRNFWAHLFARCAAFFVHGNHEGMMHFEQNADAGDNVAKQKQATIAFKRYFANPIPSTNPETALFGEDEGLPSGTPDQSWLPGDVEPFSSYAGGYAGYLAAYVIDAGDENGSPLQNYGAFSWGGDGNKLLVALCDVTRYPAASGLVTVAGDPDETIGTGGGHTRATGELASLGSVQFAALTALLEGSTWDHLCICIHNLPGGEGISINSDDGGEYFRGSSAIMTDAERSPLLSLCVKHGVRELHKGHDHRFTHVINGRLPITTAPTPSAPSHTKNIGWNDYGELEASYGLAETQGVGAGAAPLVRRMLNILGYTWVLVGSGDYRVVVRETEIAREGGNGVAVLSETTRPEVSRFVANIPLSPVANAVTITEAPKDVAAAYKAGDCPSDGTDWWSTPPTGYRGADVGPYGFDEDYTDGDLELQAVSDPVLVQAVPRTVFEASMVIPSGGPTTRPGFGRPGLTMRQTRPFIRP